MIYTIYPCRLSLCPSVSFCPLYHFALLWKSFKNLRYLPTSRIILPLDSFSPISFCPYHLAPLKSFNDLHYLPMSHIILPHILPPYPPLSFCPPPLEIFSWFTLFTHVQYHFAPYHFAPPPPPLSFCPWKLCHDLHFLPMSRIILPPGFILPPIILPSGNGLMIYNIYPCPVSFCPPPWMGPSSGAVVL